MISPELRSALKAWNELGVKIFVGRDLCPIEEWVGHAYEKLASYLAAEIQIELGRESEARLDKSLCLSGSPLRTSRSAPPWTRDRPTQSWVPMRATPKR